MQPTKLETYHETRFTKEVEADGAKCLKLYQRGYPDRLILLDFNIHFFIEFKREGEVPRKLQVHVHNELKELKQHVYTCDSYEEAIAVYNRYKAKCRSKRKNTPETLRGNVDKPHVKKQKRRFIPRTKSR